MNHTYVSNVCYFSIRFCFNFYSETNWNKT